MNLFRAGNEHRVALARAVQRNFIQNGPEEQVSAITVGMSKVLKSLLVGTALACACAVSAIELELTHWWASGGEAAAVTELAKAWDATGNTWLDGAIVHQVAVRRH